MLERERDLGNINIDELVENEPKVEDISAIKNLLNSLNLENLDDDKRIDLYQMASQIDTFEINDLYGYFGEGAKETLDYLSNLDETEKEAFRKMLLERIKDKLI